MPVWNRSRPGQAPCILVIESEAQTRHSVRRSLEQHGYQLLEAQNARDGLLQAQQHQPDAIVLDCHLSDLSGLVVTSLLRQHTTVPIVMLSATHREQEEIAAFEAGVDDYLPWPYRTGELAARVRVAMRTAAHS